LEIWFFVSSSPMRIAVIDLGTNTFNLLVAEVFPDNTYKTLYKKKFASKLGEGGINKGLIQPIPFSRGIEALKAHQETILSYQVDKTYAIATSAIRSASNGPQFVQKAKEETGIDITVISGDREAELIYYGVRSAVKLGKKSSLIMDIGGGSTEFIIANKDTIFWKHSFQLGAARLLEHFLPADPIRPEQTEEIKAYLLHELKPLFEAVKQFPIVELIGSSGSFDSLAEMIAHRFHSIDVLKGKTEYTFRLADCEGIYYEIIQSTRDNRLKMKGLVEMRVDMIVVSAIFVHLIITALSISKMRLSTYSLKEGVLWEVLHS
jgi:exopolyphosphatase/guanosine-5'-triphosphate,3'-diphosphate pyrophosphatase